jgi:HD-like signal output (HDOD) protein
MISGQLKDMSSWVLYLDQAPLPVLRRTVAELAQFRKDEDNLNGRDLAKAILHDPLMTLKVLRYLQSHHSRSQNNEITTIARAVMMLGTTRFFTHFTRQPLIEDMLAEHPEALQGAMQVISRAHHAALYAQDWSMVRHDMESDEVAIAALLHDMAEILVWCFAPQLMLEIRQKMQADHTLRSADAQQQVLGFRLLDLQLALTAEWHLPQLLQTLMDDQHADHARTRNAVLAVALARHSASSWHNAALPDDYLAIQNLLHLSPEETMQRIHRITLNAAQEWQWYGVPPAAAWLPQLPDA